MIGGKVFGSSFYERTLESQKLEINDTCNGYPLGLKYGLYLIHDFQGARCVGSL